MQLWPKIAAHFGMETGPNLHISLDTMMNTPEKKDIWAKTVKVSCALQLCNSLKGMCYGKRKAFAIERHSMGLCHHESSQGVFQGPVNTSGMCESLNLAQMCENSSLSHRVNRPSHYRHPPPTPLKASSMLANTHGSVLSPAHRLRHPVQHNLLCFLCSVLLQACMLTRGSQVHSSRQKEGFD